MDSNPNRSVPLALRQSVEETLEEVLMLTGLITAIGELSEYSCKPSSVDPSATDLH